MKRIAAVALLWVASWTVTVSVLAQDRRVEVNVPFDFKVGAQTLPSGTYSIGTEGATNAIVAIYNRQKGVHLFTMGQPAQGDAKIGNALVFHAYGGQYFLSDILWREAGASVHLERSKAEKEARARAELAGRFPDDPVLIAMN